MTLGEENQLLSPETFLWPENCARSRLKAGGVPEVIEVRTKIKRWLVRTKSHPLYSRDRDPSVQEIETWEESMSSASFGPSRGLRVGSSSAGRRRACIFPKGQR